MTTSCTHRRIRGDAPLRILVVDDDHTTRLVVRLIMERRGHEILEAASGPTALETLSFERVDLVFLDLDLPEMDGFETARRYRHSMPHHGTAPIIALTARSSPAEQQKCFDVGMAGLMAKPLNASCVDAVMEMIRSPDMSGDPRHA
jgi:CheY-like chemotaxis protein